ncbi:MAG: T9SS type A sorting domain-containing protein [Bacteroidota bacterium]
MTKAMLHAIKKFLHIGVLVLVAISGTTVNSSANNTFTCGTSCNSQLNVSLDASGGALIDPSVVWSATFQEDCFKQLSSLVVEINNTNTIVQNVTQFGHTISTTSAMLTCGFVGQTVSYTLTKYYADGTINSCWGNITVEDKMKPSIDCSDLTINCNEDTDPYLLENFYNNAVPSTSDNCVVTDLTFEDTATDYDCLNPDFLKRITRVWTVTDESGNQSTCTQYIDIQKPDGNDIVFPEHLDDVALPALECPNPNLDPSNTGYPTLYGKNILDHEPCKLSVDYEDQILETCGGSYKIVRAWTIVDWCTSEVFEENQIIKVADKTAPIIICPTIPTVGTTTSACVGNIILPPADVTDACSEFTVKTETPNGIIAGNGGLITGLPLGEHTITYIAADDCGNVSTCTTKVNIADNIPPIVICDEQTTVSLTSTGEAVVFAEVFDDGSYDNCGIVNYEVRRMDNPNCSGNDATDFAEVVPFTCCDIGTIIMVELRITDAAGNTNSCMVEVEVEDKINPIIICPTDKTLECKSDYTDLGLTGQAIATDNCDDVDVTFQDISVDISQCGEGTVTRVWTATDAQGNTASCIQLIALVNTDPFGEDDFTWPLDYETFECGIGLLLPGDLTAPYDYPVIENDDLCDEVTMSYDDETLIIAEPACYKILRKWTIVDWCQYDPNASIIEGYWQHTQVIKVTDLNAPVFTTCPADITVDNFEENCGTTFVALTVEADDCSEELNYSYEIDANNDGSIEITGFGNDASGAFANGVYEITFTVTDGCGNASKCTYLFTVRDGKKPTPVCLNGLSTELMPSSGMVTIWASDFEAGSSYDNCTDYDNLQYSFSSDVTDTQRDFTCNHLGTQTVQLWVTDADGNQDFCETFIVIQDNNNVCDVLQTATVAGVIENEMGEEIEDVTIHISSVNSNNPFTATSNGSFNFPNIPTGANYTVTPEKNMNAVNGVTTYDLVLISKHILGVELLDSPYKIIAADANKSKTVTTFDIVQLRKLILQIDTDLQFNQSWRFVDANHTFDNPYNPFADDFPEEINIPNLSSNQITNFVAIKVGDVNDSALPNNLLGTDTRNTIATLSFDAKEQAVQTDEEITVDFTTRDFRKMMGLQFTIDFDPTFLTFEDVKTQILAMENFGLTQLEEGKITVSWHTAEEWTLEKETNLFSLVFKGNGVTKLSEVLSINSSVITAEAYSKENTSSLGSIDMMEVQLKFDRLTTIIAKTKLLQNRPNPAYGATTIPFELEKAGTATLKVMDINGKVVSVIEGDFVKGYNEIQVMNLQGSGIMYYQLETNETTLTKKMILVNK